MTIYSMYNRECNYAGITKYTYHVQVFTMMMHSIQNVLKRYLPIVMYTIHIRVYIETPLDTYLSVLY